MGRINKTNQLTQCGKVRPVDWRETEGLVRNMLKYTGTCTGSCDIFTLMSNQTPKWLDVSICWFCSREVGRLLKSPSYEILPAGYCIQGYICPRFILTPFLLSSAGIFKAGRIWNNFRIIDSVNSKENLPYIIHCLGKFKIRQNHLQMQWVKRRNVMKINLYTVLWIVYVYTEYWKESRKRRGC